ncbi:MAG: VOC family protein [Coriobacteriales bacterium]|jgi:catechol 2,3-dioxygenase-like lactoylglutathione lyase family enzyme
MITRGIDHVAITVPDMEEATRFFREAFGAKLAYDLVRPDEALSGAEIEQQLGLPKGAVLKHMRMLHVGNSASIELFSYETESQQRAAHTYDFGLQHIAVYVDDIEDAAARFTKAGGKLYSDIHLIFGEIEGTGPNNRYVYGETPWGTVVELVTYPSPINYPDYSEAPRFTPEP